MGGKKEEGKREGDPGDNAVAEFSSVTPKAAKVCVADIFELGRRKEEKNSLMMGQEVHVLFDWVSSRL